MTREEIDDLRSRITARGLASATEAVRDPMTRDISARLMREAADCFTVALALRHVTVK